MDTDKTTTFADAIENIPDLETTLAELDFDDLVKSAERVLYEEDNEPNIDIKPAVRSFRGKRDAEEEHDEGTPVKKGKEEEKEEEEENTREETFLMSSDEMQDLSAAASEAGELKFMIEVEGLTEYLFPTGKPTQRLKDLIEKLDELEFPRKDPAGMRELLGSLEPRVIQLLVGGRVGHLRVTIPFTPHANLRWFARKAASLDDFEFIWKLCGENIWYFLEIMAAFKAHGGPLNDAFKGMNKRVSFVDEHDPEFGKWLGRALTHRGYKCPIKLKVGADIFKSLSERDQEQLRGRRVIITEVEMPFKPAKRQ